MKGGHWAKKPGADLPVRLCHCSGYCAGRVAPADIYRIEEKDLRGKISCKSSLNELNIVETLIFAEELVSKPETVVIGIEPGDRTSWSSELTEPVRNRMEDLMAVVLREIERAGGSWKKNQQPAKTVRVV